MSSPRVGDIVAYTEDIDSRPDRRYVVAHVGASEVLVARLHHPAAWVQADISHIACPAELHVISRAVYADPREETS